MALDEGRPKNLDELLARIVAGEDMEKIAGDARAFLDSLAPVTGVDDAGGAVTEAVFAVTRVVVPVIDTIAAATVVAREGTESTIRPGRVADGWALLFAAVLFAGMVTSLVAMNWVERTYQKMGTDTVLDEGGGADARG